MSRQPHDSAGSGMDTEYRQGLFYGFFSGTDTVTACGEIKRGSKKSDYQMRTTNRVGKKLTAKVDGQQKQITRLTDNFSLQGLTLNHTLGLYYFHEALHK